MFEVGKSYTFYTTDERGYGQGTYKVVERDGNLLKLSRAGVAELILNTSSSLFHSAEPSDHDADADMTVTIQRA